MAPKTAPHERRNTPRSPSMPVFHQRRRHTRAGATRAPAPHARPRHTRARATRAPAPHARPRHTRARATRASPPHARLRTHRSAHSRNRAARRPFVLAMPSRAKHVFTTAALPALLLVGALVQAAPAAAAPPANDARAAAQPVGALPATLRGTTVDATLEEDEPFSSCSGGAKGSGWYSFTAAESRDMLVALDADGDMDATVEVFLRQRSQVSSV